MDAWIDTLARWSAGGLSRREVLKRMGVGLAGAALVGLAPVPSAHAEDDPGLAICLEACGEIRDTNPKRQAKQQRRCQADCRKCQRRGVRGNCLETTEGGSAVCVQHVPQRSACADLQSCVSSHDCPERIVCVVNTECGSGGVCVPVCHA